MPFMALMKKVLFFCLCYFAGILAVVGQDISKEELLFLTAEWKGARFDDGRPKLADELIARALAIGFDDAWTILRNEGYNNQFDQGWKILHEDKPIAGRALTAMYIPSRPDIEKSILTRGHNLGKKGATNSWPIDLLQKGDVYVADGYGKIAGGTLIGQTLGNAIFNRSGNGVVFDASVRDFDGLREIKGFNAFVRDFHPSFLEESMLIGINTPIRIGKAIVLPGDLVLSNKEGALFIPAHLAEKVIVTAEFIQLRDVFGNERIKSGTYSVGQIDNQWDDQIKNDFLSWLRQHPDKVKMSKTQLDELMKKRTW